MSGRFFLDTNVFVYEFDLNEPSKSKHASRLVRSAIVSQRGVISYQVVQEFLNVAFKKFAKPLPAREAESYFLSILKPLLAVHSSPRLFLDAMRLRDENRLSWYDSLLIAAALESGCEVLYSEDLQSGRTVEGLRIEDPFAGF